MVKLRPVMTPCARVITRPSLLGLQMALASTHGALWLASSRSRQHLVVGRHVLHVEHDEQLLAARLRGDDRARLSDQALGFRGIADGGEIEQQHASPDAG
jgi:hypothetical protein